MIEMAHLCIVRALARHGTLAAAADALHLTQSALSHRMKRLEARLGVRFWDKQGQRLRLTAAGRVLLQLADEALPRVERTEARLQEIARGRAGRLHIAVECLPCAGWLAPALSAFMRDWPGVDVDLTTRFQGALAAALLSGEIDAGITPDPVPAPGLACVTLFRYTLGLVVGRGHRLASRDRFDAADLGGETLLTYPVPRERLDAFRLVLEPAGMEPARHREVSDTELMLGMIAAGRGVALLPHWVVAASPQRAQLRVLDWHRGPLEKRLSLLVRAGERPQAWMQAFVAGLRAGAARMEAEGGVRV